MSTDRRRFRFLPLLALCSTALATAAPVQAAAASTAAPVPPIEFTQRTLKNGLKVIAIRDTSTPNVMTSLWYEVGSKHDPDGRSGFAHLFEHILSRKTVNMPYNEINRMVDNVGGTRNASTWYDRTNYYEIVPAEYLERMLWTHAERMARPVVDQQVFETERNVVKEELRQRVLAPPYGRLFAFAFGENIYNVLPHRRPTIGSIEDLDSAKLEDARAFHEAYYGPDTATLIVSGNFDPAKLTALVDRYFGSIKPRPRKTSLAITIKEKPAHVANRSCKRSDGDSPGRRGRVPDSRRQPSGSARNCGAELDPGAGQPQPVGHRARQDGPGDRRSAPTSMKPRSRAISRSTPLRAAASSRMRYPARWRPRSTGCGRLDRRRTNFPKRKTNCWLKRSRSRETFSGRAFELGEALVRTGDPKAADKRLAGISAVTVADVRRVAQTYLNPARRLDFSLHKGKRRRQAVGEPDSAARVQVGPTRDRARERAAAGGRARSAAAARATRSRFRSRNSPIPSLAMGCGSSRPGQAKFRCRR